MTRREIKHERRKRIDKDKEKRENKSRRWMISFSLFPISLVLILPRCGNICPAQTRWYTRVHYYFFPRLPFHPRGWQSSRMFFSSFRPRPFILFTSTLLLPLSPWKPCGSYATFGRGRYRWRRVRKEAREKGRGYSPGTWLGCNI